MHSSRMRTGRSLTVFRSLQPGGVYLVPGGTWSWGGVPGPGGGTWSQGGVPGPGGVYLVPGGRGVYLVPGGRGVYLVPGGVYLVLGGYLVPGGTWSQGVYLALGGPGQVLPPPVNRMTNRCKNITLAKTSFRPVKTLKIELFCFMKHNQYFKIIILDIISE